MSPADVRWFITVLLVLTVALQLGMINNVVAMILAVVAWCIVLADGS